MLNNIDDNNNIRVYLIHYVNIYIFLNVIVIVIVIMIVIVTTFISNCDCNNYCNHDYINSGARWSSGTASDFRSRGPGFKTTCGRASDFSVEGTGVPTTCCRFKTWANLFTPLCSCLSEETLKAVGPFYLVSMPGEIKDPTQGVNV